LINALDVLLVHFTNFSSDLLHMATLKVVMTSSSL